MTRLTTAAAIFALSSLPAAAEGWSISKLGAMPSVDVCMDRARLALNRYLFDHGGGSTTSDTWSIYGFDLKPDDIDALIMCPSIDGGGIEAIMVLHSEGTDRSFVVDELTYYWNN